MSVDAYNSFLCKNPALCFINFEQTILFFILVQFGILHYNPFKYFFKNSSKCLEMSVDAYNSTLHQNPELFFEKFE